jgi:hypothetical protein
MTKQAQALLRVIEQRGSVDVTPNTLVAAAELVSADRAVVYAGQDGELILRLPDQVDET